MTFNTQANNSTQYLSKCDCGDVTCKPPFHSQHKTANKTRVKMKLDFLQCGDFSAREFICSRFLE